MELVWGIPRGLLSELIPCFQGFRPAAETLDELGERLAGAGEFRARAEVEDDPTFQQIIPYVAVRHEDTLLLLERLPGQGEERLHHKLSIGIGGHINPEPPGRGSLLVRGLEREVREELRIDFPLRVPRLLGFINDDATGVGAVHFGVACELDVDRPLEVRERHLMRGEWVPRRTLDAHLDAMETWSQILVRHLPAAPGDRRLRSRP